jgi:hypothetical protein
MPGLLTNLKIIGLKDPTGVSFDVPLLFVCMFNPDTFTIEHSVLYNNEQANGQSATDGNFVCIRPKQFSLEFVIDSTGVSSDIEIPAIPIPLQVLLFNKTTLDIDGDIHRPNYLIVQFGTFICECYLISSRITYTLFDEAGIPLRAKINATFKERVSSVINAALNMLSSPDLTHSKVVEEGDLLPLMVYREYKTQDYYLQVAKANKLKNFRKLQAGTTINLPPIT